jgi:hypothetical protein
MILSIRILPNKIPEVWDSIKFAVSQVNSLTGNRLENYLNHVLAELLNEKMHCFIRISENRELLTVVLVRFMANPITDDKTLLLDLVYSFSAIKEDELQSIMDKFKQLAKNSGCSEIMAYSYIPRMFELLEGMGMEYKIRVYSYELERK